MALVKISDSSLLPAFVADLSDAGDVIADVVADDTVRIDLLGSYGDAGMQDALLVRLRAWVEAQQLRDRDVSFQIVD